MNQQDSILTTTRRRFLKSVGVGGLSAITGLWTRDWAATPAPLVTGGLSPDIRGRTPWAVILCRFNDLPPLSIPLSEFTDFVAGPGKGGVFDYWRDVSYGAIDLTGSKVFGWWTMKYSFFKEGNQGRNTWITEAIRLAKENGVDLSPYYGVIAVVNANVDDSNSGRNLALGIRAEWGQSNWRYCKNCKGLAFAGSGAGVCPAKGAHDHSSSGDYTLALGMPGFPGQSNWRWCKNCKGLAFAGSGPGVCPAGGRAHDHSASGDYTLGVGTVGFPGQNKWRYCKNCKGLVFAGDGPGPCPAGTARLPHDLSSSGDYTLVTPAFGYESHFDAAFAAHEMGHCYGLSHAHCAGIPTTTAAGEYCDPWDIMGAGYSYKDKSIRYAPFGPGLDAPHLEALGWMPADRIKAVLPGGLPAFRGGTIKLVALNRPDIKGFLMAKIVATGRVITVEFRQRTKWDRGLPGDAVVIHELRSSSGDIQPFLLGDYKAGQRWADLERGIGVVVDSIDSASSTATVTI
jgi:hypothetical protein